MRGLPAARRPRATVPRPVGSLVHRDPHRDRQDSDRHADAWSHGRAQPPPTLLLPDPSPDNTSPRRQLKHSLHALAACLSRVRGRPARTVLRRGGRRNASSLSGDHGRLKARLRPMRGLKRFATTAVITLGHAFVQNLRRGHYELALDVSPALRLAAAFTELARAI